MGLLVLEDTYSIRNIGSLRDLLQAELNADREIMLSFEKIQKLDLAVMQVIISAMHQARLDGKKIRIKAVNPELKKQFYICGLTK
jgi:anti-anti-sigma regulatory factor